MVFGVFVSISFSIWANIGIQAVHHIASESIFTLKKMPLTG